MSSKAHALRQMINANSISFLMEAHNGLSAKIVEETGFQGIWASGLAISAALGVRDNNEISYTQVLDVIEFMSDCTSIPILLDGDTGYGNFNNARRLVSKLELRGIAGVCIEDKMFPKMNSFINGEAQALAPVDEFCGKIKAMKDTQHSEDFVVVARLEGFIAGWDLKEVLNRANAYKQAGADALLVHSKRSDAKEIEAFMKEWDDRLPVVIVPTKYYSVPTEHFSELGVRIVIWANHNVRACIESMQQISRKIYEEHSLINIENRISPVSEVFRIQGADELLEAEKKYLPASGMEVHALILAAAQGDRFGELTKDIPKTLLKIQGKPILEHLIDDFRSIGIMDITVVRGYKKEKIAFHNVQTIDNDQYATTTELYSLYKAIDSIRHTTIVCYGDIIFKKHIISELLSDSNDILIVVEADPDINNGGYHELVKTDMPYSKKLFSQSVKLLQVTSSVNEESFAGDFIGLFKVNEVGGSILRKCLNSLFQRPDFNRLRMKDLFNEISRSYTIHVKYIKGSWLDINSIVDLQKVEDF